MTSTEVAAFTADEQDLADAVAGLAKMGFEFGPSRPVTRSLLDTFDGRLHDAGLRLEARESDGTELILTGDGSVPAHLGVSSVPRFAGDLPPGPFRSRLAAVVDVRALLPVLRVTASRAPAARYDRAGKTVATATIYEHLRVADHDIDFARWTIEIDELTGYAKHAGKARDLLAQVGLSRLDADTLTVVAAAAGVELGGFEGSATVPLDPAMPAIDGFRVVLTHLADAIVANWQGTIDRLDPEFLHDLRVAVRRTRAVLAQGKNVLPSAIGEHAAERFGWLGALSGPARDLDVSLIEWDRDTSALAPEVVTALEPLRVILERRRESAHDALMQGLQSAEAAELMTTWRTWLHEPALGAPPGVRADRPLGNVVAKRIARAQANLVERGRVIRPDTPADEVHDVRKDAKKLRYLLECFGSLLPDAPRKVFVRRLKAFQDNLGEHHDAEVRVGELRAISRELHRRRASPDTMLAIGQLTERLDQRRIATRVEFAERFAAYDTKATQRALDAALAGVKR